MERVYILWNKSTGKIEMIAGYLAEALTYIQDYTGEYPGWKVTLYSVGSSGARTVVGADTNDTTHK